MKRTILIIILLAALGAAGVFAFFQMQTLESLQLDTTEAIAELEASGTQAADNALASSTAQANLAYETATQVAQESRFAAATSTQAIIIIEGDIQRAALTSTASANRAIARYTDIAESSFATGTALADSANSASTQSADTLATEAGRGTESAIVISSQSANATSASNEQATLVAQNLSLSGTLEASGWIGDGLFGSRADLPEGFERFTAADFELAMPESFDGADIRTQPRSFFALLDSLGLDEASTYLRAQGENYLFFAIDTELVNDAPRATVSLVRDTPGTAMSLSDYLGGAYVGIQGDAALIISDLVPVNGDAVGRSIVEQTFAEGSVRQMQYVFQVENSFYALTFTSPVSEFVVMRPVMEQIAMTLRLRN